MTGAASMASLAKAGVEIDKTERYVGFSCIGRFTNAGPHKRGTPAGKGCDWTLGGLFTLHNLEVVDDAGKAHPVFDIATAEEAQALEKSLAQTEAV